MSGHRYRFLGRYGGGGVWEVFDPDEVRHALQILRLPAGTAVEVADGIGRTAVGELAEPKKKSFQVTGAEPQQVPLQPIPFAMALGALKPGHIDELLPFLSEMGVDELHVFASEGVAKARLGEKQEQRWHRIALQSIKQCKRPWALAVHTHASLDELLASQAERFPLVGVLDESGAKLAQASFETAVLLICGGEKGFSAKEKEAMASRGVKPFNLGPYILQARHAVCAAAAVIAQGR